MTQDSLTYASPTTGRVYDFSFHQSTYTDYLEPGNPAAGSRDITYHEVAIKEYITGTLVATTIVDDPTDIGEVAGAVAEAVEWHESGAGAWAGSRWD